MNVVFLDYDGVVNIPMWVRRGDLWECKYNFPSDGRVNSDQCVQWVSEFCERAGYDIVVSSTWRDDPNYKEFLWKAGLRPSIKILGKTPHSRTYMRGDEITLWLEKHPEVENYLIFDDDADMTCHMEHLVQCKTSSGFRLEEYTQAMRLHEYFQNKRSVE